LLLPGAGIDGAELAPALQKALQSGKPALIDVVSDIDAIAPIAVSS
jgi:thiamine pyrophosphate-dependent acetolactate synthase large subunit-like protein